MSRQRVPGSGVAGPQQGAVKVRAYALLLAVAVWTSAAVRAEVPSISGRWLWGTGASPPRMELSQTGAAVQGRIVSGSGKAFWNVEGQVAEDGSVTLTRYVSVEELGNTPEAALEAVLKQLGDAAHPGFIKCKVELQYDAASNALKGRYSRAKPSWYSGSGELVSIEDVWEPIEFQRAPRQPDLQVTAFTGSVEHREEGGAQVAFWRFVAQVRNAGDADLPDRFGFRLEKIGAMAEGATEKQFRPVADGSATHPALRVGESATIEWRTDSPTSTANRPNVVNDDLAVRVVLDPDNQVAEADETNNNSSPLWRLTCQGPGGSAPPKDRTVWVEVADGTDLARQPPADYTALLDRIPDPARRVLCHIKLEAQRRGRVMAGTVVGTSFLRNLKTNFLADYLKNPNADSGVKATETIGKSRSVVHRSQHVPAGIRELHPELPENLEPATEFLCPFGYLGMGYTDSEGGDYYRRRLMRLIDVPFLVGDANLAEGADADFVGGGKNWSNVMHWATGVKYGNLPATALRELFLGYELYHLEGWDVFAEDALNDMIAEEQGRMLGKRLMAGDITSAADLVPKLDADFREARAWVGALLRLRLEELDALALKKEPTKANEWWGAHSPKYVSPWGGGGTAKKTIAQMLEEGMDPEAVYLSGLSQQLLQIYTLIYESDEWERRNGPVGISDVMRSAATGKYDDQFRAAPKAWGDSWDWRP